MKKIIFVLMCFVFVNCTQKKECASSLKLKDVEAKDTLDENELLDCCNYFPNVSEKTKFDIDNSDSVIIECSILDNNYMLVSVQSYSEYLEEKVYLSENGGGIPLRKQEEYERRDSLCRKKLQKIAFELK